MGHSRTVHAPPRRRRNFGGAERGLVPKLYRPSPRSFRPTHSPYLSRRLSSSPRLLRSSLLLNLAIIHLPTILDLSATGPQSPTPKPGPATLTPTLNVITVQGQAPKTRHCRQPFRRFVAPCLLLARISPLPMIADSNATQASRRSPSSSSRAISSTATTPQSRIPLPKRSRIRGRSM